MWGARLCGQSLEVAVRLPLTTFLTGTSEAEMSPARPHPQRSWAIKPTNVSDQSINVFSAMSAQRFSDGSLPTGLLSGGLMFLICMLWIAPRRTDASAML